jgi:hypothetical protein
MNRGAFLRGIVSVGIAGFARGRQDPADPEKEFCPLNHWQAPTMIGDSVPVHGCAICGVLYVIQPPYGEDKS